MSKRLSRSSSPGTVRPRLYYGGPAVSSSSSASSEADSSPGRTPSALSASAGLAKCTLGAALATSSPESSPCRTPSAESSPSRASSAGSSPGCASSAGSLPDRASSALLGPAGPHNGDQRAVAFQRDSCCVARCAPGHRLRPQDVPLPRPNTWQEETVALASMLLIFGCALELPTKAPA